MTTRLSGVQKAIGIALGILALLAIGGRVGLWALTTQFVTKAEWDEALPHIHYTSCALRAMQRGIDTDICLFHLPPEDRGRLWR